MNRRILEGFVEMTDDGKYLFTLIDHLNDQTYDGEIPDQYVTMIPGFLQQMQSLST